MWRGLTGNVAVFRVAAIADRDRPDPRRDDPVDDDRGEKHRREPDPAGLPTDEERDPERDGHDQAAEALVEVLLQEEGVVAAEGAPFEPFGADGPVEARRVGLPALRARELAGLGLAVLARREAVGAVVPGAHTRYAGNPVATVRYEDRSSPISTKTSAT